MKTIQSKASNRLFKKLSALRATLPNEERAILDNLIVDEVAAHKMNVGKATGKAIGKANVGKASEVAAHKMNVGKATGKAIGKANVGKASEVAAHKMDVGKTADKVRIAFDPTSEEYKVQE